MTFSEIEAFAKANKEKTEEFSIRCRQAMLGIYLIRKHLEKLNIYTSNNYSITYSAVTKCFHFYVENLAFAIAFSIVDDTITFKKFTDKYHEGEGNTILKYSDKARGNNEWFTDEYFNWIDAHKDAINVHPMYFYSENFSAIDYCKKHKMNLIFK